MKNEDLSDFNGKEGREAYIIHDGTIYDVSNSKMWPNGIHMNQHQAGHDLTDSMERAPHGADVLQSSGTN